MIKAILFAVSILATLNLWASSPVVSKLENDTRSLKADIGEIQKKLDSFKTKLTILEQDLAIPSHIANDLNNLDKSMTTVKNISTVASVVPPIRSQAQAVKEGIEETQPPVTKSKDIMEEIAETVEPIRQKVIKARDEINVLQGKINKFKSSKLTPFYNGVVSAQSCVDKAIPAHHSCMQGKLDDWAKPADKIISTTDTALKTIINDINKVEAIIESLSSPLKKISSLISGINLLEHGLHIMITPFLEIKKLLAKHFTIKFPYPDPHNIFKKKWFKIKLSGAQIIKGIKHIIHKIKKMLKGALLKAAKLFGLKKLAQKFFKLLDNPLKAILKKLHLKIKIKIKGLDGLHGLGLKLKNPLGKIDLALKGFHLNLETPKITACGELSRTCK